MLGKILKKNAVMPTPQASTELPPPVLGKKFPTYWYTDRVVSKPGSTLWIAFALPLIVLAAYFLSPLKFEPDIEGHSLSNHVGAEAWSALDESRRWWLDQVWRRETNTQGRKITCWDTPTEYERQNPTFRIFLLWKVKEWTRWRGNRAVPPSTIFDNRVLEAVKSIETQIQNFEEFHQVCWTNRDHFAADTVPQVPRCVPLGSVLTWIHPGGKPWVNQTCTSQQPHQSHLTPTTKVWRMSGQGNAPIDWPYVLPMLKKEPFIDWFIPNGKSLGNQDIEIMRTQITFGTPLNGYTNASDRFSEQSDQIKYFARQLVIWLQKQKEELDDIVELAWGGDFVQKAEVMAAQDSDGLYRVASAVVIMISIALYCHSIFMGLMMLCCIFMIMPMTCFVRAIGAGSVFKAETFTLPLFFDLNSYILLSITVISMFVFFSSFNQSGVVTTHGRLNMLTTKQRLAWVYRKAGIAIITNSVVLLAGNAFNFFTPIKAIWEFTVYLAIMIVMNLYMFLLVYPPLLILHHLHVSRRRRNTQRLRELMLSKKCGVQRPGSLDSFMKELFAVQPNSIGRPHTLKCNVPGFEDRPIPALQAKPSSADFRRCRRKQNKEYLVKVPSGIAHGNEDTDKSILDAEDFVKEKFGSRLDSSVAWSSLPWLESQAMWLEFARMLDIGGEKIEKRMQITEVIDDQINGSVTYPVEISRLQREREIANKSVHSIQPMHSGSVMEGIQLFPEDVREQPRASGFKGMLMSRMTDTSLYRWVRTKQGWKETAHEKQARVMRGGFKKEGYSFLERFYFNTLGPCVYSTRYFLAILALTMIILSIVLAVQNLTPLSTAPSHLLPDSNLETYQRWMRKYFASSQSNCDKCSAYYRPLSTFPEGCHDINGTYHMFRKVDECGVCGGTNACWDCQGKPSALINGANYFEEYCTDLVPDCKCASGGFCTNNGTCICRGAWKGEMCSECGCNATQYCGYYGDCIDCLLDGCAPCQVHSGYGCILSALDRAQARYDQVRDNSDDDDEWVDVNATADKGEVVVEMVYGIKPEFTGKEFLQDNIYKEVVHDTTFDFSSETSQMFLSQICDGIPGVYTDLDVERSVCVPNLWRQYCKDKGLKWPLSMNFGLHFYDFVTAKGLHKYVGFNQTRRTNAGPAWMTMSWTYSKVTLDDPSRVGVEIMKAWDGLVAWINKQAPETCNKAFHTSVFFVESINELYILQSNVFSTVGSTLLALIFILVLTGSGRMTLCATLGITVNLTTIYMAMGALFDIGPTESVTITCIQGLTLSMILHEVEGYMEFLHSSSSHLLAAQTTRKQCIRGLLLRTGVPLTGASVALFVCVAVLQQCKTSIVVRFSDVMLIGIPLTLINCLIVTPGILAIIGPTKVKRNRKKTLIYTVAVIVVLIVTAAVVVSTAVRLRWPVPTVEIPITLNSSA